MVYAFGKQRAMVHLEPGLWGFARPVNADPRAVPALL
jgi:hypothetical protein